jgi:hypothetical protein
VSKIERDGQTVIFPRPNGSVMKIPYRDEIVDFAVLDDEGARVSTLSQSTGIVTTSWTTPFGGVLCTSRSPADRNIQLSVDRLSYTVTTSSVERRCPAPCEAICAGYDGELVVVDSVALGTGSNVFRFNSDGSLRWQLRPRPYRTDDFIVRARFCNANQSVIRGYSGWEALVNDLNGEFSSVIAEQLK